MTKQDFLESSPWYESEPVRIKQLAFEDGYKIGYEEAVEKAAKWLTERTMFGVHPCGGAGLVIEFEKTMEL